MKNTPTSSSLTPEPIRPVRVFISYAWEDDAYREEVRKLAIALRGHGVDVRLDYWHLEGLSIPEFMNREVRHADKILVFGSPKYKLNVQLMEDGCPTGSGWEAMLLTSAIWARTKNRAQLEVAILRGSPEEGLPLFLSGWPCIDLTRDHERNYVDLLRRLTGNQESAPPLGQVPSLVSEVSSVVSGPWAAPTVRQLLSYPGIARALLDRLCPRFHSWLRRMGVLSTPPEFQILSEHLTELQAYLRQELDQRTYIVNLAKRVPRSGPGDERTIDEDPFALPIQRVIRSILGHSQGGDSASAQIAAINRRSRVVRNLLKTLRHSRDPLILLGDPGTGKTLTLQQAAFAATKAEQRRTYPSVPIYVRLGEFHVVEGEVTERDVLDFVKQSVRGELRPLIDPLDFDGRLIIFFDGLDEMSRQRYTEHTAALSKFAGRYSYLRHSGAKTLFSCRITDFSPAFRHSRLVLLPFSESQIREYLERSFPDQEFIEIKQQRWLFKSLARHICATDFSVDATNPFVLYLLCFYLDRKHSWPQSRTELVRFFLEENLRRKRQEQQDELSFPPYEEAIRDWAAVAFLITSRNLGGAISAHEIAKLPGWTEERAQLAVRLGRRCGVLTESVDRAANLVRLDHHRLQEYLTAAYIHAERPVIDWASKVDAPRWQETLINLVVLGGGEQAIDALSSAIGGLLERGQPKNQDSRETEEASPSPRAEDAETVLADRIEVASRIVRDASHTAAVEQKLLPMVREAVHWLFEHGNPITQVKMIRVVMQVPEPELIEAARILLKSKVIWLKNQALILLSFTGADLPIEIGEDVAEGELLPRIPSYLKALKNTRQPGVRYCFFLGVLCGGAEWVAHLATAIALYVFALRLIGDTGISTKLGLAIRKVFYEFDQLKVPEPDLVTRNRLQAFLGHMHLGAWSVVYSLFWMVPMLWMASTGLRTVRGSKISLKRSRPAMIAGICVATRFVSDLISGSDRFRLPHEILAPAWARSLAQTMLLWEWLFAGVAVLFVGAAVAARKFPDLFGLSTIGAAGLALLIPFWLIGAWNEPGMVFLPLLAIGFLLFSGLMLIGDIWFGVLRCTFTLTYIAATKRGHRFKDIYGRLTRQGWNAAAGEHTWMVLASFVAISVGALIMLELGFWRNVFIALLFIGLAVSVAIEFLRLSPRVMSRVRDIRWEFLKSLCGDLTVEALFKLLGLVMVGLLFVGIIWLVAEFSVLVARIVVVAVGFALLIFLFRTSIRLLKWLRYLAGKAYPPGTFTTPEWLKLLQDSGAVEQETILSRTVHESLSLTPAGFLEVLRTASTFVKDEPALSSYWRRRAELEQVLRQEHRG